MKGVSTRPRLRRFYRASLFPAIEKFRGVQSRNSGDVDVDISFATGNGKEAG